MEQILKRTWAKVNLDNLIHNAKVISNILSDGCRIMAVVKADAYGHGAPQVARTLEKYVGMFAVSNLDEAKQLRANNVTLPILILGYTPPQFAPELLKYNLTQTVTEKEYAKLLSKSAKTLDERLTVHVKLDTGMTRLGFACQTEEEIAQSVTEIFEILSDKNLLAEGLFTHFAVSDDLSSDFTEKQFERFMKAAKLLEERGITFAIKHCCNSGALLNFPDMQLDMVRAGLLLYGLYPEKNMRDIGLLPVMSLYTTVSQVKTPEKGATVSYGRTFSLSEPKDIATLSIGYADGFSRLLSDKAEVLINGSRAKIAGRICMDMCMTEVAGKSVKTGDVATVFGFDEGEAIFAEELAEKMGTIVYEVVCLVGKRVPRVYTRDGKEVDFLNYIL